MNEGETMVEKVYSALKEKKILLIANAIGIVFLLFGIIHKGGSIGELGVYFINQGVVIYGQGTLLIHLLRLELDKNVIHPLRYGCGVGIIIIEYLVFMGIMGNGMFLYVGYLIGAAGIFLALKNSGFRKSSWSINNGVITVALGLCFVTFLSLFIKNAMPDVIGRSGINQDILWSIGNTESLIKNYPPMDARMSGVPFVYHYFVNIYYAVISVTTGIDPVALYFKYGYIVKMFFVVGSIYAFGFTFLKSRIKGGVFTLIYFFTACASMKKSYGNGFGVFMNSNLKHLTDGAFGFELSLGLMMTLFVLMYVFFKENRSFSFLVPIGIVFFALSGTKGPIGLMVLLAVISSLGVYVLVNKKNNKRVMLLGIVFGVIFTVLFTSILKSGSGDLNFELGYIAKDTPIGRKIFQSIGEGILSRGLIVPIHLIFYLPFGATMFSLWIVHKALRIKECDIDELLVGAMAVIGIICAYIFKHYGHSEIYFLMTAVPFMNLAGVNMICSFRKNKIILSIGVITLIIGGITGFYSLKGRVDSGLKYNKIIESGIEFTKGYHPNTIMSEEYKGIKWIKENTDEHAIILSDRYYISDKNIDRTSRYFYYSALSQRQFYLEGYFYFYAPDEYKKEVERKKEVSKAIYKNGDGNLARDEGIDYVILSKNLYSEEKNLQGRSLKVVFDNDYITIYEVE